MEDDDDDDEPFLSPEALAALRELAVEQHVAVDSASDADVVSSIRAHFDLAERDEVFDICYGDVAFQVKGLKRILGQTLQSTGLTIWRAADHLCGHVAARGRTRFRNARIVELGAGLGVVAILVAKLSVGATVVATDGDAAALDLLRSNVALTGTAAAVSVAHLWWGDHADFVTAHPQPFDFVLAADVVYQAAQVEPLVHTATALLARDGVFLLSYAKRNVAIDLVLQAAERAGLEWRLLTPPDSGVDDPAALIYELRWRP